MNSTGAFLLALPLLVGYFALGIWLTRKTWAWSSGIKTKWMRVFLASTMLTVFFTPGVAGGGHGAAIAPAWLMFATGTFDALTSESKRIYLLSIVICWAVVFVTWLLMSRRSPNYRDRNNPFD